jgi:hypothetical protein
MCPWLWAHRFQQFGHIGCAAVGAEHRGEPSEVQEDFLHQEPCHRRCVIVGRGANPREASEGAAGVDEELSTLVWRADGANTVYEENPKGAVM